MSAENISRPHVLQLMTAATVLVALAFSIKGDTRVQFLLPGTQPGQIDTAAALATCKVCHLEQVKEFYGNMAYATRDPLFLAQMSITSKTTMDLGLDCSEYCLRCHAPSAWMMGRSHWMSVQNMYGSDLDGVNCDFCHRMVDPIHPDSLTIMGGVVPGYGNGMYAVQKYTLPVRGARGVVQPFMPTLKDPFYRMSQYCGVCHDESNVYFTDNPTTTPPHLQTMYQRTFSEWLLSWFATQGEAGTCQACHMPRAPGYGASLTAPGPRLDIASHDFSGGNTVHMRGVRDTWEGIDSSAVDRGVQRSKDILKTAARLEVSAGRASSNVQMLVRLTNLIGHKIPSGFPEGRRMWISVTGRDRRGSVVFESGKYDEATGTLASDAQLKVYETRFGTSYNLAARNGWKPGPSFNESVNDSIYWDNRIPPKGYAYETFKAYRAEPVGYRYADGQYWDETSYTLPFETHSVEVNILYQVASREYAEYLRNENVGNAYDWNAWGQKAYDTWRRYGSPVAMASQTVEVGTFPPQLPVVEDVKIAIKAFLSQNYPNPFNASTTIGFWLSEGASVNLSVYDISGRAVERLVDAELPPGSHTARVDGSRLATGVYFYRLSVNGIYQTKKFLLMK